MRKKDIKSGIYIITCLVTDKHYIGYSNNMLARLANHRKDLKYNKHDNQYLQNEYNLYGLNNFMFEILEYYDIEFLPSMENYWCNMLDTHNRKYGYNLQPTSPYGNICMGNETKAKLSLKYNERRDKVREQLKGKKLPENAYKNSSKYWLGNTHTQETKDKISKAQTGKKYSNETNLKKGKKGRINTNNTKKIMSNKRKEYWNNYDDGIKVIQYTKDMVFIARYDSIRKASKETGISELNIKTVLKGKRNSVFGFKWERELN